MFDPPTEVPDYHYYDPDTGRVLTELPDDYDVSDDERD